MANIWRAHTITNQSKKHLLKHYAKINGNSTHQYHRAATLSSPSFLFNSNNLNYNRHCHDIFVLFPNCHSSSVRFFCTARNSQALAKEQKKRVAASNKENEALRCNLEQMATYYDAVRPGGSNIGGGKSGAKKDNPLANNDNDYGDA
ncbi:hypothetical protein PIB30_001380 [Stylosanthes scabra]|uniref:Uncharacterized protein n=1 Tax=Stylosanthes scabra TaxID=79078 RepID=A0ABU6Z2C1_9FABA|nr:hypothetical protein [Stylosanthes scabra]